MLARPIRWSRRHWKKLVGLLVLAVVAVNVLAARHAQAFLTYAPAGEVTPQPEQLSKFRKLGVLFTGVSVPRPENTTNPAALGLPFTPHRLPLGGEWLEVWHVPADGSARGVVLLFPGYASAKNSLLPEAFAFRSLGFDTVLVDFRGAGGSSGHDTTLGVREADDVAAVTQFAADRWPGRPVVLFGRSMGAAAVLRAVGRLGVSPAAVIVECPFDRMLNAVHNRFGAMGMPSFPAAQLLVFWGGRHLGFDGFSHNPTDDAEGVHCPALVLAGSNDTRATPAQVRAVYDNLPGPKRWHLLDGAGHEPLRARAPAEWEKEVSEFLAGHVR
jgi:alpha-beta hydrolase superfamily lysophospholipase